MTGSLGNGTDGRLSRRTYLVLKAAEDPRRQYPGDFASLFLGIEAVSSVAIEHPEWDMDERKTWAEWEASK